MVKKLLFTFLSIAALSSIPAQANANTVTYYYTGQIAVLPAPIAPFAISPGFASYGITSGTAVSGSFTYVTGGTDRSSLPEIGSYAGNLTGLSLAVAGKEWNLASAPNNGSIQIDNDLRLPSFLSVNPGYYSDNFRAAGDISGPAPSNAMGSPLFFGLELDFGAQSPSPNSVFTDTSIPSSLRLSDFNTLHHGFLTYSFTNASGQVASEGIRFNIATLSTSDVSAIPSPVPEPETYAMMLAGLGVLGAIARRRKSKQTA